MATPTRRSRLAAWVTRLADDGQLVTAGALVLAAVGFALSSDHVLTLARANGQTGWHAWCIAGVAEILAAISGLEIRRRAHAQQSAWAPKATLVACIAFMVAANLSTASGRVAVTEQWGQVLAVYPALTLTASLALLETRRRAPRPTTRRRALAAVQAPAPDPVEPAVQDVTPQATATAPAKAGRRSPEKAAYLDLLTVRDATGEEWPPPGDDVAAGHGTGPQIERWRGEYRKAVRTAPDLIPS